MSNDRPFYASQTEIKKLVADPQRDRIYYDAAKDPPGFGVRVTKAGVKSFVQAYYVNRVQHRCTIAFCSEMHADLARKKANAIHSGARDGKDPLAKKEALATEKTVSDLADTYLAKYARKKKRPKSVDEDGRMIEKIIKPRIGKMRISEVAFDDIDTLHGRLKDTPYQANRVLALLSTMFNFAIKRKWRSDNPTKGVTRYKERERLTWIPAHELQALDDALSEYEDQSAANAVKLLMLTGARPSELLNAEWTDFNLALGFWFKSETKQGENSNIPLSKPALAILRRMQKAATCPYLFPGKDGESARTTLKNCWAMCCRRAGLVN